MSLSASVALCTYNGAAFLHDQLASIAAQTRPPAELVVCDDGSADDTVAMLACFAASAGFPCRIVRNDARLGTTKNFEKAISLCSADVVFLCDQDDVWMPHKVESVLGRLEADPSCGGVFSDASLIDEHGRALPDCLWDAIRFGTAERAAFASGRAVEALARRNFVTGAMLAFRARWRGLLLPFPASWFHDAWAGILLAAAGAIDPLPETLVAYRLHPGQQIGLPAMDPLRWVAHKMTTSARALMLAQAGALDDARARVEAALPHAAPDVADLAVRASHLRARAGMRPGLRRLDAVGRELFSGRYHRYSTGTLSALKDAALSDRFAFAPSSGSRRARAGKTRPPLSREAPSRQGPAAVRTPALSLPAWARRLR